MTFRCIWTPPGAIFPTHVDYRDRDAANLAAIRLSRELKTEVEVHDLDVGSIGSSRWHLHDERNQR